MRRLRSEFLSYPNDAHNPDNNQHSPNVNIRLGNFFERIAILASVLTSEAP